MVMIDLPLVGPDTTLRDAFRFLLDERRSAIAVHAGDKYGVVTAQQIVREARKGASTIGEIAPIIVKKTAAVRPLALSAAGSAGSIELTVGAKMHAVFLRGPDICQCQNPDDPHGPYQPSDDGRKCDECKYKVHCAPWEI